MAKGNTRMKIDRRDQHELRLRVWYPRLAQEIGQSQMTAPDEWQCSPRVYLGHPIEFSPVLIADWGFWKQFSIQSLFMS
jgi:hypothetical protein